MAEFLWKMGIMTALYLLTIFLSWCLSSDVNDVVGWVCLGAISSIAYDAWER